MVVHKRGGPFFKWKLNPFPSTPAPPPPGHKAGFYLPQTQTKDRAGIFKQSMVARNRPSRNRFIVPARRDTWAGGIDSWAP
jgi:hypothetical protein